MVLRGNQNQAWTRGFELWWAERVQDGDNRGIGSENAESDGGNDGTAENERHQERNHDLGSFYL
jgi:hypothetical protein